MSIFSSKSEESRFLIERFLDGGQEKTRKEIMKYLDDSLENKFFNDEEKFNVTSGALHDLTIKNKIINVRRGVYKKASANENINSDDAFDVILKKAISEVEKARTMDIDTLTSEDLLRNQEKSRRIISVLKDILNS